MPLTVSCLFLVSSLPRLSQRKESWHHKWIWTPSIELNLASSCETLTWALLLLPSEHAVFFVATWLLSGYRGKIPLHFLALSYNLFLVRTLLVCVAFFLVNFWWRFLGKKGSSANWNFHPDSLILRWSRSGTEPHVRAFVLGSFSNVWRANIPDTIWNGERKKNSSALHSSSESKY